MDGGEPMVGRDDELRMLTAALEQTAKGSAAVVVVQGAAGIGKTRLLGELVGEARRRGLRSFRGAARAFGSDRPLGPVIDSLRPVTELHGVPQGVDDAEDAVEQLAMQGPLVLALDDLHWADPESLVAIHRLAWRVDLPILLVLARRPVSDGGGSLETMLHDLPETTVRMQLDPLPPNAVTELASDRLGAPPGRQLTAHLARAGGNPLFILELLAGLRDSGDVRVRDGFADAVAPLVPDGLRKAILRRVGQLGSDAADVLRAAAIAGASFTSTDIVAITRREPSEVVRQLTTAIGAGFVTADGSEFGWSHDLVRDALYEEQPPALRRSAHLLLADALSRNGSRTRAALHLARGATSAAPDTVDLLVETARAIGSDAPTTASELFDRAAQLVGEASESARLQLESVPYRVLAGDSAGALALIGELKVRRVAGLDPVPLLRAELPLLTLAGRMEELAERAGALLVAAPAGSPHLAEARAYAAAASATLGQDAVAQDHARRLLETDAVDSQPFSTTLAHRVLATVSGNRGDLLGAVAHYGEAVASARTRGRAASDLVYLAAAESLADRRADAETTFGFALEAVQASGIQQSLVEYHWFLGVHLAGLGRWDDALAELATSRSLAAETGAPGTRGLVADPTAWILWVRGDNEGAARAIRSAPAELAIGRALDRWLPGLQILVDGDGTLDAWCEELLGRGHLPDLRLIGRSLAHRARSEGGRTTGRLASLTEECLRVAGDVGSVEVASLLVRSILTDDVDLLRAAFERAPQAERPLLLADVAAELGVALLRRGDGGEECRRSLEQASDIWATVGAVRLEAELAATARSLGLSRGARGPRVRATSGWDALTPTERRVSELVIKGLTNTEIGARLFTSKGTVATHLRSIFRKLAISSRAELAAEVARRISSDQ
jgi:DNA-binding CsgD family transcriptional regulator/tetratricopeptide (TPR) repeat protein